jgi:hypothetical protein
MEDLKHYFSDTKHFIKPSLIAAAIGLAASAAGLMMNSAEFFFSYLTAYMFWTSLTLGGLFFVMLHHISGAVWSTVLRRLMESLMQTVPIMAILFIPIAFGIHDLYHWSHADAVAADALLQKKEAYLNIPFFLIRTLIYFSIWFLLAHFLYKTSIQQDQEFRSEQIKRLRTLSAPGIVLFALSITFASFDWLMSLDPHWYSTIFGLYFFAGSFLSATAFLVIVAQSLRTKGYLKATITTEHFHDLGKFLFAFTIFWGYMAFSQYFLIWYANIPEETIWYLHRWEGSWKILTLLLVFGHFLIPFMGLMTRASKRNLTYMKIMSFWILLMHYIDLYWIIMPIRYEHGIQPSWMDFATIIGVGGVFLWFMWSKFWGQAMVPVNDPNLDESIRLVN